METRKKEIYCNQRGCFEWVNPRQSLYCTKCEYNRKEFEAEDLQQILFESLCIDELPNTVEHRETKQDYVVTQTSETNSSDITKGLFTDDTLEMMLDLVAKEPTVDDDPSIITPQIPKRRGILRLEKLAKK
jgi:hypothetical protein